MPLDRSSVQRAIEGKLGRPDSKTKDEFNYRCPNCLKVGYEKVSHFHVNYTKGVALCHQCHLKAKTLEGICYAVFGRLPDGVTAHYTDEEFLDAIHNLLWGEQSEQQEETACALPDEYTPLSQNVKDSTGKAVLHYLCKKRGVDERWLSGIGYCRTGRFAGYAIFPITVQGVLVSWTSRNVSALNGPKVLHAKHSKARLALFNHDACESPKRLFVTEGPFDAWHLHGRFRPSDGGLATLGTLLHTQQAYLIDALAPQEVIFCYDNDATAKAHDAARVLSNISDSKISVMELPDARDPDEIPDDELFSLIQARTAFDPFMDTIRKIAI